MNIDEKIERANEAIDRITDEWATETNLLGFVFGLASRSDRAQAIEDACRQCFSEGAIRGFYAGKDLATIQLYSTVIQQMAEALAPFAAEARHIPPEWPGELGTAGCGGHHGVTPTVDDYRRVTAAIAVYEAIKEKADG